MFKVSMPNYPDYTETIKIKLNLVSLHSIDLWFPEQLRILVCCECPQWSPSLSSRRPCCWSLHKRGQSSLPCEDTKCAEGRFHSMEIGHWFLTSLPARLISTSTLLYLYDTLKYLYFFSLKNSKYFIHVVNILYTRIGVFPVKLWLWLNIFLPF